MLGLSLRYENRAGVEREYDAVGLFYLILQNLLVGSNGVGEIVVGGVLVDPPQSPQKD